ncbi:MAG TPA: chemotaxis response regulator protein-glutamate methylesterase [Bryobacteraceae bacterium]
MQRKIRVLVVDDSPLARRLISGALEEAGDIEVVGSATDGYSARAQVTALRPDVLTLDIGMPGMDGITFLKQSRGPAWLPAVVISAMTGAGCQTALDALQAGAAEVIGKPVDKSAFQDFRAVLPVKVRAAFACRRPGARLSSSPSLKRPAGSPAPTVLRLRTPGIIAIGSSTGGTEAVETILRQLPGDTPGIVIAQHIPARFSLLFAERLKQVCKIQVKEAGHGDLVRPGLALIAPGDQHMLVQKRPGGLEVALNQGPRVGFQRPSVDMLFHSVASLASEAIGVILTGMGNDGAAGLLAMKRSGAITLAQDEASCAVFGMPKEAIRIGAADHVLSLTSIAASLGLLHTH